MIIILKNKETLKFDDFSFKCTIGKNGLSKKKIEGDKRTPIGLFSLGDLYYRSDKVQKPKTKLKCIKIKKNMGWCNDINYPNIYNKLIKVNTRAKQDSRYKNEYNLI